MNEKNKQEEIQTRREFFKKAAKATLPVLGAVVLSSIPFAETKADYVNFYTGECTGCSGSCQQSCSGTCSAVVKVFVNQVVLIAVKEIVKVIVMELVKGLVVILHLVVITIIRF
jgi:CXXX repeat radical SAM target protein